MRTTIVGLADLADAMRALAPEGDGWLVIARALGLDATPAPAASAPARGPEPEAPLEPLPAQEDARDAPVEAEARAATEPEGSDAGHVPLTVEVLARPSDPGDPPAFIRDARPLPRGGSLLPPAPRPAPLIPRPLARSFLLEAVGQDLAGDEPDLDALIAQAARCEIRAPLARLRRRGFRNGVFAMVDEGPPMDPFRGDVVELLGRLRGAIGPHYLGESYFQGLPTSGHGDAPDPAAGPPASPRPGATVLIVADLGVGRPRGHIRPPTSGWAAAARRLIARGCRVVVLTPYAPRRGPRMRIGGVRVVTWGSPRGRAGLRVAPLELGRVLAAAAQVDRALLRAAIARAFPGAEPGLEADFLFSPLVAAWNERVITVRDDVLRRLRDELADDPDARGRALRFLADYRRAHGTTELIRFEEALIASALAGPEAEYAEGAARLARSLLDDEEPGRARWAWGIVNGLPGRMRSLEITEQLRTAAALRLGVSEAAAATPGAARGWLMPADATLGISWSAGRLTLREPPAPDDSTIRAPATTPRFLFLESGSDAPATRLQVEPGGDARVIEAGLPAELRTLSGVRYRVAAAVAEPPGPESQPPVPYAAARVLLLDGPDASWSALLLGETPGPVRGRRGERVRVLDRVESEGGEVRETFAYADSAPWPDHPISRLHLRGAAVVVVTADPSDGDRTAPLLAWGAALHREATDAGAIDAPAPRTLLVATGVASGGEASLGPLAAVLGAFEVLELPDRDADGIAALRDAIHRALDWDAQPRVGSAGLLEAIRSFLSGQAGSLPDIMPIDGLFRAFLDSGVAARQGAVTAEGFADGLRVAEVQGVVRRLADGRFLLRPARLDADATALVDAAASEPDGLGSIREDGALGGPLPPRPEGPAAGTPPESLTLAATIAELIDCGAALREPARDGARLVFPSLIGRGRPALPDPPGKRARVRFRGDVRGAYATLAVALAHGEGFRVRDVWGDAVRLAAAAGGTCGVQLLHDRSGGGEILLFADGATAEATRRSFEARVRDHLDRRVGTGDLAWEELRPCPREDCPGSVPAVEAAGQDLACPVCKTPILPANPQAAPGRRDRVRSRSPRSSEGRTAATRVIDKEPKPSVELKNPVPTLVIALGGTGLEVARRLRRRLRDDADPKAHEAVEFVLIDTDPDGLFRPDPGEGDGENWPGPVERVACQANKRQLAEVDRRLDVGVEAAHLRWLTPGLLKRAMPGIEHSGASGHRQVGRLLFFLNYSAIRHAIQAQLSKVLYRAHRHPATAQQDQVEIVIVASLAGGTGSGMLIDAAYLARDILREPTYAALAGSRISLMTFLADLAGTSGPLLDRCRQNAYAALRELEHYGAHRDDDALLLGEGRSGAEREARFVAGWDGLPRPIDGRGWDACYLIDDRNDVAPHARSPGDLLAQRAADFLALDFGRDRLATARRSSRANLVQWCDRRLVTAVRGGDTSDAIFAAESSCAFSSFGLAGLHLDLGSLYQGAGERMAARMTRERWLGKADRYSSSDYREWARADLLRPIDRAGSGPPPSFHPDSLSRSLFVDARGDLLEELDRNLLSLAEPRTIDEALALFSSFLEQHRRALGPIGATDRGGVRSRLAENRARLAGNPSHLGPLRARLAELVTRHLAEHGVAATLQVLGEYRNAIGQATQRARESAEAHGEHGGPLAALRAASQRPRIFRPFLSGRIAQAREAVGAYVRREYDMAAAAEVAALLVEMDLFIGEPGRGAPATLARHGTLYERCERSRHFLGNLAERLDGRFEARRIEAGPAARSAIPLSPRWDVATYDRNTAAVLAADPRMELPHAPSEWSGADARHLERAILARLEPGGDIAEALVAWQAQGPEADERIGAQLARACVEVLHESSSRGGLRIDLGRGGLAEDLMNRPPSEARSLVERVVAASQPNFRMVSTSFSEIDPIRSDLLAMQADDPGAGGVPAARVEQIVRACEEEKKRSRRDGPMATVRLDDPTSLWVVRELGGLPLQSYGGLDELHNAYVTARPLTGNVAECHIGGEEAMLDLPEIRPIDVTSYARIRDHLEFVLLGMIVGQLRYDGGVWQVPVSGSDPAGSRSVRLGRRLHATIRAACGDETVCRSLLDGWHRWVEHASPRDWAGIYASAAMTWGELSARSARRWGLDRPPLQNAYEPILRNAESELSSTEEGRAWLRFLRGDAAAEADAPDDEPGMTLPGAAREIVERIAPEWPIYRIVEERLARLETPATGT